METIIIILFITLVLLLLKNSKESFKAINYHNLDRNKIGVLDFPEIPKYINLSKLTNCQDINIKFNYGYNLNYIWNNGKYIGVDILRQSRNHLVYNGKPFQLRVVQIGKSNLIDGDKSYLLQLELLHSDFYRPCNFKIVIPIELTPEKSDIELFNLKDILQYKCCDKNYGRTIENNFYNLANLINQSRFKKYDLSTKQHLIFTVPLKVSITYGMSIINKLNSKYEHKIVNKSKYNWLDYELMDL